MSRIGMSREKHHPDAILPRFRQAEADLGAFLHKEVVRDLNQNARSVTRLRIAAAGSTVGEVDEDLNALLNDVMGFGTVEVDDESHAAVIVFILRVVKTLLDERGLHSA